MQFNFKQMIIWLAAMLIGFGLGMLGCGSLDKFFDFIANIHFRTSV